MSDKKIEVAVKKAIVAERRRVREGLRQLKAGYVGDDSLTPAQVRHAYKVIAACNKVQRKYGLD